MYKKISAAVSTYQKTTRSRAAAVARALIGFYTTAAVTVYIYIILSG